MIFELLCVSVWITLWEFLQECLTRDGVTASFSNGMLLTLGVMMGRLG